MEQGVITRIVRHFCKKIFEICKTSSSLIRALSANVYNTALAVAQHGQTLENDKELVQDSTNEESDSSCSHNQDFSEGDELSDDKLEQRKESSNNSKEEEQKDKYELPEF